MKNTFFKSSYNLWRAVFMSLSILTVSDACAKSSTNGEDNKDKKAVTIQMIASTDSTITVNVKVDNQHGDKFSIAIENMKEGQLYKEMFTNNAFETNYTLPKPESDNEYSFIISSKNKALSQKFSIKTITRYVEDVTVTKL